MSILIMGQTSRLNLSLIMYIESNSRMFTFNCVYGQYALFNVIPVLIQNISTFNFKAYGIYTFNVVPTYFQNVVPTFIQNVVPTFIQNVVPTFIPNAVLIHKFLYWLNIIHQCWEYRILLENLVLVCNAQPAFRTQHWANISCKYWYNATFPILLE